jgi:flagellar motor switch protein FliN/FliY
MAESTPENPPEVPPNALATVDEVITTPEAAPQPAPEVSQLELELRSLPTYSRGLLQIRVPVHVKLASQRKSVKEIIELGPGSIVKFEKTYDEPLEVCVGDRTIAEGEVVKVGDKFGVRINGLVK